jgi:hypothetical protein
LHLLLLLLLQTWLRTTLLPLMPKRCHLSSCSTRLLLLIILDTTLAKMLLSTPLVV